MQEKTKNVILLSSASVVSYACRSSKPPKDFNASASLLYSCRSSGISDIRRSSAVHSRKRLFGGGIVRFPEMGEAAREEMGVSGRLGSLAESRD